MKLFVNELVKIKHAKSLKILCGIFFLYIPLSAVLGNHSPVFMRSGFAGPFLWNSIMGAAGLFAYGAIAAWMVAAEFELGVVRNAIGCGISKPRYFAVKIISVLGISTLLYLLCTCIFTAVLTLVYGFDPTGILPSDYWRKVLVFNAVALAVQLSCLAFYLFLAYLLQAATSTFVTSILMCLLDVIVTSMAVKSDKRLSMPYETSLRLMDFFLEDIVLTPEFSRLAIPCLCTLAVSLAVSYILFLKSEV